MFTTKLPTSLEEIFAIHKNNNADLLQAFMPVFCDHVKADRIFLQPRNPNTRVCKVMRWRRNETIPWPAIPGDHAVGEWFVEDHWEDVDPLWRSAMLLKQSIYIEDLQKAANEGTLNLEFENSYMFHTAFIHGHAHWPPMDFPIDDNERRDFYGSVQPAVFDGPRVWTTETRKLVEECLVRITPAMKAYGESAPSLESLKLEMRSVESKLVIV